MAENKQETLNDVDEDELLMSGAQIVESLIEDWGCFADSNQNFEQWLGGDTVYSELHRLKPNEMYVTNGEITSINRASQYQDKLVPVRTNFTSARLSSAEFLQTKVEDWQVGGAIKSFFDYAKKEIATATPENQFDNPKWKADLNSQRERMKRLANRGLER